MTLVKKISFIILILAIIQVHQTDGKWWKKIVNPLENLMKHVGKIGDKVSRGIGKGLGKTKKLVEKMVIRPFLLLEKSTFSFLKLFEKRKKKFSEIDHKKHLHGLSSNEPFDQMLLNSHNKLRDKEGSGTRLVKRKSL